jgi:hypothetical protein
MADRRTTSLFVNAERRCKPRSAEIFKETHQWDASKVRLLMYSPKSMQSLFLRMVSTRVIDTCQIRDQGVHK